MGHSLDGPDGRFAAHRLDIIYGSRLIFLMPGDLNDLPSRLIDEVDMENTHDWLSRLLEMIPVKGTLDYRCFLGAPWRIDFAASQLGEIPYHVILGGSAVLEDPEGGPTRKLVTGDILLFSPWVGSCGPRRERCGPGPGPPAAHAQRRFP